MKPYEILKNEGVKFIRVPPIEALGLVYHGFSTKVGGVSTGRYKGMNLSLNAGEDQDFVEINRCMFAKAMDAGNPEVYTVRQMHGTRVIQIESNEYPAEEFRQAQADAIVTDQSGIAIGVLTADCVPVLLVDPVNRAVAAVHSGREGALMGVVSQAIDGMQRAFGSMPRNLVAAVGPCIETSCYEVGEEIVERAAQKNLPHENLFVHKNGSHFMDLRKINHLELLDRGVQEGQIHHISMCTACHSRTFYSHRRSKGKKTGRMMAFIMLKEN